MQPSGMQLYQTNNQQNILGTQNGFPMILSNYNNVNQLQNSQQALLLTQQQIQQQTQQQQYLAMYMQQQQQQQRQILLAQQQYPLVYQLNKQPQINSCFNSQLNQTKLLIPAQPQTQLNNMMYNLQPSYNYPMFVQPVMAQPTTQQVQFIPLTQVLSDQTLNVAKPFDNLTKLCQNTATTAITNSLLDQFPIMQKGSSQNLNFPQVILNQTQGDANIIQNSCTENQILSPNSDTIINQQITQSFKENINVASPFNILQQVCQLSSSITTKDDEQISQISKTSCSKQVTNKNPRRGFRLSNHEAKTLSIGQMSPKLSESPIDTERERLKLKIPPIVSKPIKKMSKDGSFTEDKCGQQYDTIPTQQYTIKIQKVDHTTQAFDEKKFTTESKLLLGSNNPFSEKENDITENLSQIQEENCENQAKENKNQLSDSQNSDTSIQSSTNALQKNGFISKIDETEFTQQFLMNLSKQDTEKLVESIQEQINKVETTLTEPITKGSIEDRENENNIDNKMVSELSEIESQHGCKSDSCTQSQFTPDKDNTNVEDQDVSEKVQDKKPLRHYKKRKIQKQKSEKNNLKLLKKASVKSNESDSKKKLQTVKQKEDAFRISSNIQLENVLPTKTRGQQTSLKINQPEIPLHQTQTQKQDSKQNEYTNVDSFQEATQNIMAQFELYYMKHLKKKDDDLIQEFKTFMSNARKNDEYISQLLNPVECDFSDSFIEFLRGPAQKWIKKNIEQKKQSVYYQLVDLFKSEDRGSAGQRTRKTRAGSNYSQ